jgi:O-antigen/teichoic acid export membrane protein
MQPETSIAEDMLSREANRRLATSIGKNTLFGVFATGALIATRLVTVPVVIHHLGLDGYGIWSIIMVTAGYMRFGAAGIKSAFQKYVAEATGTGAYEAASVLLSTGSISMLILSVTCLVPTAILSRTFAEMTGVPQQFLAATASSVTVLALTYAISNFGSAFEAIVMGGHRIDLVRKFNVILTTCEAAAIITLLHFGFGLLAMTMVMCASELILIFCCYQASRRVVPQISISFSHFNRMAFPELLRYAGSYQLVNILELVYIAVVPLVLLKFFGAAAAGIFAIATRLVASGLIAQDALVIPILSGGAVVFASRDLEKVRMFLAKTFKMTLGLTVPPLALVCAFGPTMVMAWTGQIAPEFLGAIWFTGIAGLFRAISLLQLVLYRATGHAVLDNIRQVLRIAGIFAVGLLHNALGFQGVLAGMALAELLGIIFMFIAMSSTFREFSFKTVAVDAFKILTASILLVLAGWLAVQIPIPWSTTQRAAALLKLAEIATACLVVAWPAAVLTNVISAAEKQVLLNMLIPKPKRLAVDGIENNPDRSNGNCAH